MIYIRKYKSGVLVTTILSLLAATQLAAKSPRTDDVTLRLKVTGIAAPTGQVMIALFDSEDGFEDETPIDDAVVSVSGDKIRVRFRGLAAGDYAIKLFHDENGNGELDTGFMGIPSEPYAFSRQARDPFSAPEWDEARFTLSKRKRRQTISLK